MAKHFIAVADWVAQGEARFGKNRSIWRVKCPSCGCVQSRGSFESLGMRPHQIDRYFGQSCIGRWYGIDSVMKHDVAKLGEPNRGFGCRFDALKDEEFAKMRSMWYIEGQRPMFYFAAAGER